MTVSVHTGNALQVIHGQVFSRAALCFIQVPLALLFPQVHKSPSAFRRSKLIKLLSHSQRAPDMGVVKGHWWVLYKETKQPGNEGQSTFQFRPEEAGHIYKLLSVTKLRWSWVCSLEQYPSHLRRAVSHSYLSWAAGNWCVLRSERNSTYHNRLVRNSLPCFPEDFSLWAKLHSSRVPGEHSF